MRSTTLWRVSLPCIPWTFRLVYADTAEEAERLCREASRGDPASITKWLPRLKAERVDFTGPVETRLV